MRRIALALLAAGFGLTLVSALPWGAEQISDIPVYRAYARDFLDGLLPYRDVGFEYPPLAAPLLALPGLIGTDYETYRLAYAGLALALAVPFVLLTGALAVQTQGDRRVALVLSALAPLACGAMLRTHFDLAPVVLLLGALVAVGAQRPRLGLALLGVGAVTKAFPLLAVPVVVAWLLAHGQRRQALQGVLACAAVVAVVGGGAYLLSPAGARAAVSYQTDRPAQVESSAALLALALDRVGIGEARAVVSHRSDGVEHPAGGIIAALLVAALVGLVAWLTFACSRTRAPPLRDLAIAALGTAAGYAVLGKVLSPQFLIWVLPLAALAWSWRLRGLALAASVAVLATFVEFPAHYRDVVARDPTAIGLVAARDLALVATLALVVSELSRRAPARGSARSTSPDRSRRPRPAPH